ncbi:alpha/beta hydrolase [Algoriphagus kandeliae]|uniref:Alpha/beta hydrolase n=1 Tax=Algoriphagus kandeliae TaxID=2562278 RepID=A0A4Y9QXS3_9BACT|nr:alpha/beta hydrolase [Algoriphagus kandeliae]TFV97139.1 alpha/beta hydrolase [Algoriphagus kandeliae]
MKNYLLILLLFLESCAFRSVVRDKEIPYIESENSWGLPQKELNVFSPKKANNLPVLIFIHGGSWNKGRKEIYDFLGNRMARREVVTVIIDYPLAPAYHVDKMEQAVLLAVKWVEENISEYGGDPNQIFISGHSAGGHLAALAAVKNESWQAMNLSNPLKGAILNDPAGLDWYWFLEQMRDRPNGTDNYDAFTDNPEVWKAYSPIYFLEGNEIPMLLMEGEKTYPGIRLTVERFRKEADEKGTDLTYSFYSKTKHIPMITQYFWTWKKGYDDVLDFIQSQSDGSLRESSSGVSTGK